MKKVLCLMVIVVSGFCADSPLVGQKAPAISGVTLNGRIVDSLYFKGKVTLLNFMYIGCRPCMKELIFLNELDSEMKGQPFQILCVAPHSPEKLLKFNSDERNPYSAVRRGLGAPTIRYDILPQCIPGYKSQADTNPTHIRIMPECEQISKEFGVEGYPVTYLVDMNGIIRNYHFGYPMEVTDSAYREKLRKEIGELLK